MIGTLGTIERDGELAKIEVVSVARGIYLISQKDQMIGLSANQLADLYSQIGSIMGTSDFHPSE